MCARLWTCACLMQLPDFFQIVGHSLRLSISCSSIKFVIVLLVGSLFAIADVSKTFTSTFDTHMMDNHHRHRTVKRIFDNLYIYIYTTHTDNDSSVLSSLIVSSFEKCITFFSIAQRLHWTWIFRCVNVPSVFSGRCRFLFDFQSYLLAVSLLHIYI